MIDEAMIDRARGHSSKGRHSATRETRRVGVARGLLGTIPILIAGTMTMGMALAGPIAPNPGAKNTKPKNSAANLREAIRDAMQRQAADARANAVLATDAVVSVAAVPST